MKPVCAVKDRIPVEGPGSSLCHAGVAAVIEDDRRTRDRAGFEKVHPQSLAATHNSRGFYLVTPELCDGGITQRVVGQHGHERRL